MTTKLQKVCAFSIGRGIESVIYCLFSALHPFSSPLLEESFPLQIDRNQTWTRFVWQLTSHSKKMVKLPEIWLSVNYVKHPISCESDDSQLICFTAQSHEVFLLRTCGRLMWGKACFLAVSMNDTHDLLKVCFWNISHN